MCHRQRVNGPTIELKMRSRFCLTLVSLALAACTVGPDFVAPASPSVARFTLAPLPARTNPGATGQTLIAARDIPGEWWTLLRSPALDELLRECLRANPNLVAAQATLRSAQETALAQEGALYPQVNAQLGYSRQNLSIASTGGVRSPTNLYNLASIQLNGSYALDLFGGTRRQVEASIAAADIQRFQLEAVYLAITVDVVLTAIQEASFSAQIGATEDIITILRQQLVVVQAQLESGSASVTDVLTQQTTLAQVEATLPPLRQQLQQQRDLLAILAGRLPAEGVAQRFELTQLALPQDLPVSLPSSLIEQRPDVQVATAQLHQATALVGVATANLLPQFTFSVTGGQSAFNPGSLFSPGTALWSLGAGVIQPIFVGGTLRHQRRAAVAAAQASAAQYQATVLSAFQSVASALQALQADAAALAVQRRAADLASRALDIARSQLRLGSISFLTLLVAQRNYTQTRISVIQAQVAQYSDVVNLFQALGGGWRQRHDVQPGHGPRSGPLATLLDPDDRMPIAW